VAAQDERAGRAAGERAARRAAREAERQRIPLAGLGHSLWRDAARFEASVKQVTS